MKSVNIRSFSIQCFIPVLLSSAAFGGIDEDLKFFMQEAEYIQTTVSRMQEATTETPGGVYVFTKRAIAARGYRSLGELLQTVPGFTVFHRDLQFVAGVRGLNANDNEKISLLLNGQNINGVMEPDFLNGPIDLDNVKRVEVVVGPSSLFQQANTLAATVNVITEEVHGAKAVVSAGNALNYAATLMAGHNWGNDKSLNFSFTTERKNGFDAWSPAFRPGLRGRSITGELDQPSFFSVLSGKSGDWKAQAAAYSDQRPELLINNASPANDGYYRDQIYTAFLSNEHPWTSDLTSVFRSDISHKKQTRENIDGTAPVNAVALNAEQLVYTGELGLRYRGFDRQTIHAGLQGSYDHNFDTWFTYAPEGFLKAPLVKKDSRALGFYLDDTFVVNERFRVIAGARADRNTRLPGNWYMGGRAAVIGQPSEIGNWTSKLIYNRAVRFPSVVGGLQTWGIDKPATSPSWAQVSPSAHYPEILSTYELQQIVHVGDASLSLNLYHQELKNFITWFAPWTNVGNFRGNGVEFSVTGKYGEGNTVWANASYNDSTLALFRAPMTGGVVEVHHSYTNPAGNIIGSARWLANAGVDAKLSPRLTFSPAVRVFAAQTGLDNKASRYVTLGGRAYMDAGLTWSRVLDKDADLRLSGQNILANRKRVASQMTGDTYRPRGADLRLTLYLRF